MSFPTTTAIIVLNYKTAALACKLVENVRIRQSKSDLGLYFVIIDNNSGPMDRSILENAFKGVEDVKLIFNFENLGYAAGNNVGLRFAKDNRFQYCLIVNTDIEFLTDSFVEKFIKTARDVPDCGLVGPRILLSKGGEQYPLPPLSVRSSLFSLAAASSSARAVYATTGCCIFGPADVFQRIGYLDERTFLYREEQILAEKLKMTGLVWQYNPEIKIFHDHQRKLRPFGRLMRHKRYEFASTILFFREYKKYGLFSVLIYTLLFGVRTTFFALYFGVAGCLEAVRGNPTQRIKAVV